MNWFSILKNQISVPSLSMRQMDLDNIIEEDDEDCYEKVRGFFRRLKLKTPVQKRGMDDFDWDLEKFMTHDEACELYEWLTSIIYPKFMRAVGKVDKEVKEGHDFSATTIDWNEFGKVVIALRAAYNKKLQKPFYFEVVVEKGHTYNAFSKSSNKRDLEEVAKDFYNTWSDAK